VAATDMFKTVLVKTGRFQVVERSHLNEGVLKEKQLNARNGDILDAVNVKKPIKSSETNFGVSGAALGSALGQRPRNVALAPDVQAAQRKAEGADAALRAAIEDAVTQLAARFKR